MRQMPNAPTGSLILRNMFSHTYFQNCMREWNRLDESGKSSPTASVFKSELMRLIRQPKRSLFGFHDIKGVQLLTRLRVEFSDLREHITFSAPVPCASARLGLEITSTFSCTTHATVVIAGTSLTASRMLLM